MIIMAEWNRRLYSECQNTNVGIESVSAAEEIRLVKY